MAIVSFEQKSKVSPPLKKLIGYQYLVSTDNYTRFNYTRTYSHSGGQYITTYKLYHPISGLHTITITATHYKFEKRVEVSVEYANGGLFSSINNEQVTYGTPTSTSFGFRGSVSALGGNRVPNQLEVKFSSSAFENVKVLSVAGSHENNDFEFFLLDKN